MSDEINFVAGIISKRPLEEYIAAVILIGSSLYSAFISKKVEKGIIRINELELYNKDRKKYAKQLEEILLLISDNDIDTIGITEYGKINGALKNVQIYDSLLKRKENKMIEKAINIIELDRIESTDKKKLVNYINYFISKLKKGDIKI